MPDATREELERDRGALREQLAAQPPPERAPRLDEPSIEHLTGALENARHRERVLRERREALAWHDRRGKAEIDELLARNRAEQARRQVELRDAVAERGSRDAADSAWLNRHRPAAERLLAVAHELDERHVHDRRAARRLRDVARRDPLHRDRDLPSHERDIPR